MAKHISTHIQNTLVQPIEMKLFFTSIALIDSQTLKKGV